MYFSEIYSIFFLDSFFHFLYLFKMWEIFMPHPVEPQGSLLHSQAPATCPYPQPDKSTPRHSTS